MGREFDSFLGHEQAFSPLEDRSGAAPAAERAGLRARGSPVAVHRGSGHGEPRPFSDQRQLHERAGPAAVRPAHDDGAAAQRLCERHLFVAADGEGLHRARGLHDDRGGRPA